jgi:ClpP class serine protease
MDELQAELRDAIADPAVRGVILDIRSPGGICWLVPETAKLIRELSTVKPIYGVRGSAGGERRLLPPGAVHEALRHALWRSRIDRRLDDARRPIEDARRDRHQGHADLRGRAQGRRQSVRTAARRREGGPAARSAKSTYDMFTGDVAQFFGVSLEKVLADFGQGRCLQAADALAAGMVDGIASLDDVRAAMAKELDAQQSAAVDPLDGTRAAIPDLETRSIEGGEVRAVPVVGSETPLLSGTALKFGSARAISAGSVKCSKRAPSPTRSPRTPTTRA